MVIQVRVLGHSRVFDPTGADVILHPWIHPHPTRTELGMGAGFILPAGAPQTRNNSHNFSQQPNLAILHLISHTVIRI
jgi:hypothetical protein